MIKKKKKKVLLLPKKIKFKRLQKGHLKPVEKKVTATHIYYGLYGLKILKSQRLGSWQLEAARRQISRHLKRHEFLWIRVVPDIPVTKKPNEIRMGKGKGNFHHWVARAKAGQIIFELICLIPKKAQALLMAAAKKLSIPCAVIENLKKIS